MHFSAFTLLNLLSFTTAWLPGDDKRILSRSGLDLFNRKSLYDAGRLTKRFLPNSYGNDKGKIRGVNLGSLFVLENWLADDVMSSWGCPTTSEFDCVSALGQTQANIDFQSHWGTWITADDFTLMVEYGLNTVRIPIGYWMYAAIVDSSEHFPQGGIDYLDKVVGYASDTGIYVILDLHGAPGAQSTDADTGQLNPNPGFYDSYNYNRTYSFFEFMTNRIHTNTAYSTVGMVMLVNEPERTWDTTDYPNAVSNAQSMRETYYPTAWTTIRDTESSLSIAASNQLHIQMMDALWSSGDPKEYLPDLTFAAYDDHEYVKYAANLAVTKEAYMAYSCADDRSGNWPVIVGEWSLSVDTSVQWTSAWDPATNIDWYKQWWAAQVLAYEKQAGWVFWTWKTTGNLNDPRWDYQKAVALGIVDKDPDVAYSMDVCSDSTKRSDAASGRVPGSRWLADRRRRSRV